MGRKTEDDERFIAYKNNIGSIVHARSLKEGNIQSKVFKNKDLPPIFDESMPKYDVVDSSQST